MNTANVRVTTAEGTEEPEIRFTGWWGDEHPDERAPGGYLEEPWETFTIMVHGESVGDMRPITVTELLEIAEYLTKEDRG